MLLYDHLLVDVRLVQLTEASLRISLLLTSDGLLLLLEGLFDVKERVLL